MKRALGAAPYSQETADSRAGGESIQGFTLLELLVVIAILAVLASLLLPVLSKAKGKAQSLECLSHLKQWNAAFRMYVDEHESLIPRECYEPLGEVTLNNWSQVRGRSLPNGRTDSDDIWYNALPPYLSQRPVASYAAPPERAQFYDRRNLIHCPSAQFPSHAYRPNYQFPLFSLAYNSQLIQNGPTINFNLIENGDVTRTVLFLDNLLEGERPVHPAQEISHLGQPAAYANRFSARHTGSGNLAFADGHVASFLGRQVVETDPQSPLVGGPILPPQHIVWEIYSY